MPRNASPARSSFGRGKSRVDSFEIISAPPRNPVVRVLALLVRLRAELFVLAVLATAWFALGPDHTTGPDGHTAEVPGTGLDPAVRGVVLAAVGLLLAVLPWTRRFLFHRAQAVITRHRVRQTLVESRVLNHSRACPLTLWARPTRVGEVVWVMLRAGIGPDALASEAEEFAAACFAREARVTAWPSTTNLIGVEIIRRDPLAPNLIRSDLFRWASGDPHDEGWNHDRDGDRPVDSEPRRDPVAALVPTARPATDGPSTGTGRDGDWSDYV